LVLQADSRVETPLIEPFVAAGDQVVGARIVEAVTGDAETADRQRDAPDRHRRPFSLVVDDDPRRPASELALQAFEHLGSLDHVGVAGVVDHTNLLNPGGASIPWESAILDSSLATERG
jgi:hypothetical protein